MAELIPEPAVTFERLPSPQFNIVPGALTRTIFFGTSKPTTTIKNEAVTRGATNPPPTQSDALANVQVHAIDKIFDVNGVVYFLGTDFTLGNADMNTAGTIQWLGAPGNFPLAGTKYFVTYEVNKPNSFYNTVFDVDSPDQAADLFGTADDVNNRLSVAARIFFANGAVRGSFLQMTDTLDAEIDSALAALVAVDADILVPLIPASIVLNVISSIVPKVKAHVFQESQPAAKHERIALLSATPGTSVTDYKTIAAAIRFGRIALSAPPDIKVTVNNVSTDVDGTFTNAAIAGFLSDPNNDVAVPTTRKQLFGIDDVGVSYTRLQANDLTANGVLVVQNKAGVIRVLHGVTTDNTNLNESELSVVRIGDFIGNLLTQVLEQLYIGTKIDPTTIASIRTTIEVVLTSLVQKVVIVKFQNLSVVQNISNPVEIDVNFDVFPIFPLNLISVKFSFSIF